MFPNRKRNFGTLRREKPVVSPFFLHELFRKALPYHYGIWKNALETFLNVFL